MKNIVAEMQVEREREVESRMERNNNGKERSIIHSVTPSLEEPQVTEGEEECRCLEEEREGLESPEMGGNDKAGGEKRKSEDLCVGRWEERALLIKKGYYWSGEKLEDWLAERVEEIGDWYMMDKKGSTERRWIIFKDMEDREMM